MPRIPVAQPGMRDTSDFRPQSIQVTFKRGLDQAEGEDVKVKVNVAWSSDWDETTDQAAMCIYHELRRIGNAYHEPMKEHDIRLYWLVIKVGEGYRPIDRHHFPPVLVCDGVEYASNTEVLCLHEDALKDVKGITR